MKQLSILVSLVFLSSLARAQYTQWASASSAPGGSHLLSEVSGDGSTVVFISGNDALSPLDSNGLRDTYAYDRATGQAELVSASFDGNFAVGAASIDFDVSGTGRYVTFTTNLPGAVQQSYNRLQVFVRDRETQTTTLISAGDSQGVVEPGDGDSYFSRISRDGRFVYFFTIAQNFAPITPNQGRLVVADRDPDGNGLFDEQVAPEIRTVIVPLANATPADLSDDGRYVFYNRNVPPFSQCQLSLFVLDRDADGNGVFDELGGTLEEPVAIDPAGVAYPPACQLIPLRLSGDGRHAFFAVGGTLAVRDRVAQTTTEVAVGVTADASMSATGRHVVYSDNGTYIHDRDTDDDGVFDELGETATTLVSVSSANDMVDTAPVSRPGISDDGRVACFEASAVLVPGAILAPNIYVHETGLGPYLASYCTPSSSSAGCSATIDWSGYASLSDSAAFEIQADDVQGQKVGLLFYGFGSSSIPFLGGTLCVQPPLRRTPPQFSGGGSPDDCSGAFTFDQNSWIQSGQDPFLVLGQATYAQYWYRDPNGASGSALSNALQMTVLP